MIPDGPMSWHAESRYAAGLKCYLSSRDHSLVVGSVLPLPVSVLCHSDGTWANEVCEHPRDGGTRVGFGGIAIWSRS